MKTIISLVIILFCLFNIEIVSGQNKQKDSVIIITGVIDKRDLKRISQNLKNQIDDGSLDGALSSAKALNKKLESRDSEKIIEVSIKSGRLLTANRAAEINKRKLEFKEVYTTIWINEVPIDSVIKYSKNISAKNAHQLQKFYINRGDVRSAEHSAKISGQKIKDADFVKMSKINFQKKNMDLAILSAKKGGDAGREELGKLLKIFINIKDLNNAIKTAAAIGGKNMTVREWALIKTIIPPANIEDITEFINKGRTSKKE